MTVGKVIGGAVTLCALGGGVALIWVGGQAWGENDQQTDSNTVEIEAHDVEIEAIKAATVVIQQAISEKAAVQAAEERGSQTTIEALCASGELSGPRCE